MSKIAVVAVGGNALARENEHGTAAEIERNADEVAVAIDALIDAGWRVVVVHGNGPQVGNLSIQQESVFESVPAQPLYSLCAMSQGQLGSVLVRAIDARRGPGAAVAVVSHVVVALDDPAFDRPTKPIGPFFDAVEAERLAGDRGWDMVEDSGRGHRRVVPSPRPGELLEAASVEALLAAGKTVLAAGGGGVAVARTADGGYAGVDVVIDKDASAALLAAALGADALLLVTAVESVSIDFGTARQRALHDADVAAAQAYLDAGQFPAGSMGPKVKAAIDFASGGKGMAVITTAERLVEALHPSAPVGTRIVAAPVDTPIVMSPA